MRNKILIVDDMAINRALLSDILDDSFTVLEAENGAEAVDITGEQLNEIAIILLDLNMPVMNGFEVLNILKSNGCMDKIPVLVITGETSTESEDRCLDFGVSDFIHKPFDAKIVRHRVKNVIDLYTYKNSLEDKISEQTDILKRQNMMLQAQAARLQENNRAIIDVLGTVVESRNLESGDHIQRVKSYTRVLAEQVMRDYPEYGLTRHSIDVMVPASALHDVGKIAIPDSILLKPGRLTAEEFSQMKEHTTRGYTILKNIEGAWDDEYKEVSCVICRHHHERFDGKGYPDGLAGDNIPIAAQIVSIADVYDALVSKRVYKDAYSLSEAFDMIISGQCGLFSPKLLECFRKVRAQYEELAK